MKPELRIAGETPDTRRIVCCGATAARDPRLLRALAESDLHLEPVTSTAAVMSRVLDRSAAVTVLDAESESPDARSVLRRRRELGCTSPILLLLDPDGRVSHREAFEMGADDCVSRPVRAQELVARLHRLLNGAREAAPSPETPVLEFGAVRVDLSRFVAWREDRVVPLPSRAFQLLDLLARRRGCAVSRDAIIDELWGPLVDVNQRTIDNLVLTLRQLIEPEPREPRVLRTVHRVGYRLEAEAA